MAVYIPPSARANKALMELHNNISALQTTDPDPETKHTGSELYPVQLGFGLPYRQAAVCEDPRCLLLPHHSQHWLPTGLRAEPPPVHPAHTRLLSETSELSDGEVRG